MAKCSNCARDIENAEIIYRPSTKGGRRTQSIRLCSRCIDQHDRIQSALKARNIGIVVALVAAVIVAAVYLIVKG